MEYTRLGGSGLYVSRLALGTIPFGSGGGFEKIAGVSRKDARRQIDEALDHGVNFIDTANIYTGGDAERVLGEVLGRTRDEIILTSKARSPVGEGPNDSGASRYHLTRAVEDSLSRLRTDHLDLLYIHQWDGQTPITETIATANELIRAGKIRYWGVSNFNGWQLAKTVYEAKLAGLEGPVAQQVYYTPEAREIEYEIIPAARDLGVATFGWSPLGEGLLNGKVRRGQPTPPDTRQGTGWPEPHVTDRDRAYDLIELFDEIARDLGWSIPQVVISWILDRPGVDGTVIAARRFEHLQDDLAAAGLTLPREARDRITAASQLPAYYPLWHRLMTGQDRPEPSEAEFYAEHRPQVLGEENDKNDS
ncbi:aldo/keto reductase [Corynebacterium halotolerans]|uniref:Oxidoreductase n=1 Tax=Corynebacterium halotolerans YIM 70093 = DSM 44683 TaxID=1121362 RepID=M1NUY6_9CORY|nr:aldo/keto reductase [Corynebacterium halotolerans]AGF71320.1 oxidoreductase [Corynebacterium halotolerans YIM 70093 = DSM 44683]